MATVWQITVDKVLVARNGPKITFQLPEGVLTVSEQEAISLVRALKIVLEGA
jgi:hypothetical protein